MAKENKTVDFRTLQEISKSFSDFSYSKGVSENYSNTYRKYLGSLSCKFLTWTFLLHFYFDEKYDNLDLYCMARHTLYLAWGLDRFYSRLVFPIINCTFNDIVLTSKLLTNKMLG